jgi:hypothetical protein
MYIYKLISEYVIQERYLTHDNGLNLSHQEGCTMIIRQQPATQTIQSLFVISKRGSASRKAD